MAENSVPGVAMTTAREIADGLRGQWEHFVLPPAIREKFWSAIESALLSEREAGRIEGRAEGTAALAAEKERGAELHNTSLRLAEDASRFAGLLATSEAARVKALEALTKAQRELDAWDGISAHRTISAALNTEGQP
jgi:hypothetical protein